jgi:hypothetical protein
MALKQNLKIIGCATNFVIGPWPKFDWNQPKHGLQVGYSDAHHVLDVGPRWTRAYPAWSSHTVLLPWPSMSITSLYALRPRCRPLALHAPLYSSMLASTRSPCRSSRPAHAAMDGRAELVSVPSFSWNDPVASQTEHTTMFASPPYLPHVPSSRQHPTRTTAAARGRGCRHGQPSRAPWPPSDQLLHAFPISVGYHCTSIANHHPRCALSPPFVAAANSRRWSCSCAAAGCRGQRATIPLSVIHDHRQGCSGTGIDARPSARRRWLSPGRNRRRQ